MSSQSNRSNVVARYL